MLDPIQKSGPGSLPVKGVGKGKTNADGAPIDTVISKMIPLLVSIDRKVNQLEDRAAFVVIINDEDMKLKVSQIREIWKQQDPNKKQGNSEDADMQIDSGKPTFEKHPLGPQRSIIFRTICELAMKEFGEDSEHHKALKSLFNMAADSIADSLIFRAKPRHYNFMTARAWIWGFILHESVSAEHRKLIKLLLDAPCEKFRFAPQHTTDGPTLQWLLQWLKASQASASSKKEDHSGSAKRSRKHD